MVVSRIGNRQLGNAPDLTARIRGALDETSGAVLITGPAGSGKSTTLYACLRHLVSANGGARSIVSIEDPIEVPVGCPACQQTGYAGRVMVSEFLDLRNPDIGGPVLRKADSRELHRVATALGMECLRDRALRVVQEGRTSPAELVRVLGSTARG